MPFIFLAFSGFLDAPLNVDPCRRVVSFLGDTLKLLSGLGHPDFLAPFLFLLLDQHVRRELSELAVFVLKLACLCLKYMTAFWAERRRRKHAPALWALPDRNDGCPPLCLFGGTE